MARPDFDSSSISRELFPSPFMVGALIQKVVREGVMKSQSEKGNQTINNSERKDPAQIVEPVIEGDFKIGVPVDISEALIGVREAVPFSSISDPL